MSVLQKFFVAILPKRWADSMREESMRWLVRCCTCDASISYWEMGGIRWKAASKGKRILFRCPNCQRIRAGTVEKV